MGTYCAPPPLPALCSLQPIYFYFAIEEISSCLFLGKKDAEVIEALNSTSRCLDDLLHIDNTYTGMVNQIYPSELQLNKANSSDTEAPFLDLILTISDGFVSSKIYDKHADQPANPCSLIIVFADRCLYRTTDPKSEIPSL